MVDGVTEFELSGMDVGDAVALAERLHIRFNESRLRRYVEAIDCYPLALRATYGGVIKIDRHHRRFSRWLDQCGELDPALMDVKQRRTHVLRVALGQLGPRELYVISTITAFRRTRTTEDLIRSLVGMGFPFSTESELDRILVNLEQSGLIGWDRSSKTYDMHPVARGVIWQGLTDIGREHIIRIAGSRLDPRSIPGKRPQFFSWA